MIRTTGHLLKTRLTKDILRVTLLLGLLFALAPRIHTQTQTKKPSDVFFSDSPNPSFASNLKAGPSIVKKGVTLRGWLMKVKDPAPVGDAVYHNDVWEPPVGGVYLGIEDVHYRLLLDYDFIHDVYGNDPGNARFFLNAVLPGDPVDSQTKPIPLADSGNGTWSGIGINSFWAPCCPLPPLQIKAELNAWHKNGSHHCDQILGCGIYRNYDPMGTPPLGWIHKDDYMQVQAADNWWPFDPDNPDGQPKNLQSGNYVEIGGTLWQDTGHDAPGSGTALSCWGQINHNQDGWLEIHPVDYITRVVPAGGLRPSPVDQWYHNKDDNNWYPQHFSVDSARAGVKRVLPFQLCADATGAAGNGSGVGGRDASYAEAVCPEAHYDYTTAISPPRTPTALVPHVLELIDGRFSTPQFIRHGAAVNTAYPDCVSIQGWLTGVPLARFKATYVVWWTPAPPAIINQPANNVVSLGQSARFAVTASGAAPLTYQWRRNGMVISGATSPSYVTPSVTPSDLGAQFAVVVSNSVGSVTSSAATIIGQMSATVSTTGPKSPVIDTITVTSGGAPLAGVTVTSGNSTFVTNASGVVVMTHTGCVRWNGPIPKVGDTKISPSTPVPCNWTATASKAGYQTFSFSLP
jgi:hypothetical protein